MKKEFRGLAGLLTLLSLIVMLFAGCKKEKPANQDGPSITVTTADNGVKAPGQKIQFNISLKSSVNLREVKIGDNIIKTYDYKHNTTSDQFTYEWIVPDQVAAGEQSMVFTVSDKQAIPKAATLTQKVNIVVPGLGITVTKIGTDIKLPGEKISFNISVSAEGKLGAVKLNNQVIKTYNGDKSTDNFVYEWIIPADVTVADEKTKVVFSVNDQFSSTRNALANVDVPISICAHFNEGTVNTGPGKVGISDFADLTSGRLKAVIVASETDRATVGVINPSGCGKVLKFEKTANIGWGGWNGFQMRLSAFAGDEFTSFARNPATRVLKVDVYRDGTKSGIIPDAGLNVYVSLVNEAKFNKGPKPKGRGQFFVGHLSKGTDNKWVTLTFTIDGGSLDPDFVVTEADLIEIDPGIDTEDDGGTYYFDNLRLENK
jgi:hypothetical protein